MIAVAVAVAVGKNSLFAFSSVEGAFGYGPTFHIGPLLKIQPALTNGP